MMLAGGFQPPVCGQGSLVAERRLISEPSLRDEGLRPPLPGVKNPRLASCGPYGTLLFGPSSWLRLKGSHARSYSGEGTSR